MMKLEKLLESISVLEVSGSVDVEVKGISYDSRNVMPGFLFVAVRGHKVDGTHYVVEALSKGAVAVVTENHLELGSDGVNIRVANARLALAEVSNAYFGDSSRKMKVVGITGTNGKTTTAYMIRDLLRDGGFQPGLLGTVSYEIGDRTLPAARTTPEAPEIHSMFQQMRAVECDSVVMEVSSHAIALQRIEGIDFDISVFTNLTQDHLDYHKDMETYFDVKAQLFKPARDVETHSSIINIDDPWGCRLVEEGNISANVTTYGFSTFASVRASNERLDENGTRFHVSTPWGESEVHLQLLGRFNISNALAALATGGLCGTDLKTMARSLAKIKSVPGRLELIPNRRHKKVFVDYAHTDDALRNVLTTLREICKERLIVIFGCGGDRDRGKRRLMGLVASELADYSIITSDNPRNEDGGMIASNIIEGFSDQQQFEIELDRREAIQKGLQMMGRSDILLVAGKGHETYQEFKGTIVPFDDREVIGEL
jgi:UDP-N-acetylmuramoyl-L-alanyl-D-glutamate--2,6-diaminopimelate ligase